MGRCSSIPSEVGLVRHQEISPPLEEVLIHTKASAMGEGQEKTDFNHFFEVNNAMMKMAREKFEQSDQLKKDNYELKRLNEELKKENESLRQRMNNDSEMIHRGYQRNSEDVTSRNKLSDVLKKYQGMDGNKRKHAIEAFGSNRTDRTELWLRKDLTCRIFVTAYNIARHTNDAFNQMALPKFFLCAPSVGVNCEERGALSSEASKLIERAMQQPTSEEINSLLSTKSIKVACSSVLKEMAVDCDLKDLEERTFRELKKKRDQWMISEPWLPQLEDEILSGMKSFITDCVRIAWRMVNLLPPLKIMLANDDDLKGERFDDYFHTEKEEVIERSSTITLCVWPALTDHDGNEVLVKGRVVIIQKPERRQEQMV